MGALIHVKRRSSVEMVSVNLSKTAVNVPWIVVFVTEDVVSPMGVLAVKNLPLRIVSVPWMIFVAPPRGTRDVPRMPWCSVVLPAAEMRFVRPARRAQIVLRIVESA